jgi:hypothetical protein
LKIVKEKEIGQPPSIHHTGESPLHVIPAAFEAGIAGKGRPRHIPGSDPKGGAQQPDLGIEDS